KMNDLHEGYMTDGEIIYAAKVDSARVYPGKNRAILDVGISSQRIETLRIYWNDSADSADIAINNQVGVFSKPLANMEEKDHIFYLVGLDRFGNRSLPFEASGTVYGDRFQNSLSNRTIQTIAAEDGVLSIGWGGSPDNAVYCELIYTDKQEQERTLFVPASENSTSIADWSAGLRYRTSFLPDPAAIDTFYTDWRTVSNIPFKYSRAGWTVESRNGNHDWGAYGGSPALLLDGDRNTGWHSTPGSALPQCLVVDMKESRPVDHLVLWHLPAGLTSNWIYFRTIEVYLSDTPVTPDVYQSPWGAPAAAYEWPGGFDGINVQLNPNSRGRYLILYFPNSRSNTYISFAELEIYGL
ncbi:MAG: discoidin domain-containing protein, partial [Tannerella sp.]|nr:discoidin domain-containing protein [Tannerella sp.]